MNYFLAFIAIFKGFRLCFFDAKLRALSVKPWLLGVFCYITSLVGAYYAHRPLLNLLIDEPTSIWTSTLYYISWIFVGLLLLVATMAISLILVMIVGGVFQTAIAAKVLSDLDIKVPDEQAGVKGVIKETSRTILVETAKLLWLIPIFLLLFIVGFIPLFAPFAFLLGAWLLAFQFIDIPLDVLHFSTIKRFSFAIKNWLLLTLFGISLTFIWAIPFLGILLPPVAVAGGSWLIVKTRKNELTKQ